MSTSLSLLVVVISLTMGITACDNSDGSKKTSINHAPPQQPAQPEPPQPPTQPLIQPPQTDVVQPRPVGQKPDCDETAVKTKKFDCTPKDQAPRSLVQKHKSSSKPSKVEIPPILRVTGKDFDVFATGDPKGSNPTPPKNDNGGSQKPAPTPPVGNDPTPVKPTPPVDNGDIIEKTLSSPVAILFKKDVRARGQEIQNENTPFEDLLRRNRYLYKEKAYNKTMELLSQVSLSSSPVVATVSPDKVEIFKNAGIDMTAISAQDIERIVNTEACRPDIYGPCLFIRALPLSPQAFVLSAVKTSNGTYSVKAREIVASDLNAANNNDLYKKLSDAALELAQVEMVITGSRKSVYSFAEDEYAVMNRIMLLNDMVNTNNEIDILFLMGQYKNSNMASWLSFFAMKDSIKITGQDPEIVAQATLDSSLTEVVNIEETDKYRGMFDAKTLARVVTSNACILSHLPFEEEKDRYCLVFEGENYAALGVRFTPNENIVNIVTRDFSDQRFVEANKEIIINEIARNPVRGTQSTLIMSGLELEGRYHDGINLIDLNQEYRDLLALRKAEKLQSEMTKKHRARTDKIRNSGSTDQIGQCYLMGKVDGYPWRAIFAYTSQENDKRLLGNGELVCNFPDGTIERQRVGISVEEPLGLGLDISIPKVRGEKNGEASVRAVSLRPEMSYQIFASGVGYGKGKKAYICEYAFPFTSFEAQLFSFGLGWDVLGFSGCDTGAAAMVFSIRKLKVKAGVAGLSWTTKVIKLFDPGDFVATFGDAGQKALSR